MKFGTLGRALLVSLMVLAGCSGSPQNAVEGPAIVGEDPQMRTRVPLVRAINVARAGELVDIEFDLPPPNRNAASSILIGMRISRSDVDSGDELAGRLIRAHVQSQVRLSRIESGKEERIQLSRMNQDRTEHVLVPESGEIPILTRSDVESTELEAAGLSSPDVYYTVLMFATAYQVLPGRYRLKVQLNSEQAEFEGERIDLLVAHLRKGK